MGYLLRKKNAFTLVEVVVAIGIFVFAGFALISLIGVGLQGNLDSKERLQAANITESICATRRAAPTANLTTSQFPLPSLSTTANNFSSPIYLTWDGVTTTSTANARFGFVYNITAPSSYTPGTNPGVSTVYMSLYWPALAPASNAAGHFEVTTTFALP